MVLSIDIGSHSVHLLFASEKNGIVEVKNALTMNVSEEASKNQNLKSKELLGGLIRSGIAMSGTSVSSAMITIKAENIIIRKFEVPSGKDREVSKMVRDEMVYFYNASESDVIEYQVLGESGGKLTVRAAAMGREIVDYYYSLLSENKLKPAALDIHMNSVSKLMAKRPLINGGATDGKSIMLLDFGYESMLAHIFPATGEEILRDIPIGYSDFETILTAQVIDLTQDRSMSPAARFAVDPGNEIYLQAPESFQTLFSGIVNELTKLVRYYLYQGNQRPMDAIYLYGGGSGITGLSDYLTDSLGINTERIVSVSNIRMTGKAEAVPVKDFINAAGAVIRT